MIRTLFTNIAQLVQPHADEGASNDPLTITQDASVLVENGRVIASGATYALKDHPNIASSEIIDLNGMCVVPGFVDSHTHVVHAGDRVDDLGRRSRGETYASIAKAGGGIMSSVGALSRTAPASVERASLERLEAMLRFGTTTVEAKTGYGLTPEAEARHLAIIDGVKKQARQEIFTTLLAHVLPLDARQGNAREDALTAWHEQTIAKAETAQFFDVFVEDGAFTVDETRKLAGHAKAHGKKLKLHVDQLRDGGGAALAAELGALSADHLEHTSQEGARALAERGVIATILPGCGLQLGDFPDGRMLRAQGCEVAIATDCNPGSSPYVDLGFCALMAATQCGLTLEEALWGITRGGAKALGLQDRGRMVPGERADFVVVRHHDWRAIFARPGRPPIDRVVIAGMAD